MAALANLLLRSRRSSSSPPPSSPASTPLFSLEAAIASFVLLSFSSSSRARACERAGDGRKDGSRGNARRHRLILARGSTRRLPYREQTSNQRLRQLDVSGTDHPLHVRKSEHPRRSLTSRTEWSNKTTSGTKKNRRRRKAVGWPHGGADNLVKSSATSTPSPAPSK